MDNDWTSGQRGGNARLHALACASAAVKLRKDGPDGEIHASGLGQDH